LFGETEKNHKSKALFESEKQIRGQVSVISYYNFTWPVIPFQNNEYMQSVARCLQMMLRIDEYRFAFVAVDGISTLLAVLQGRVNFQVQYQLIFCLWVLTFNPLLAEKMNK
jgi:V-type H+-transporting ATPase subunit H